MLDYQKEKMAGASHRIRNIDNNIVRQISVANI